MILPCNKTWHYWQVSGCVAGVGGSRDDRAQPHNAACSFNLVSVSADLVELKTCILFHFSKCIPSK